MAKLTFVGAAGTVTGSKHLLTLEDKHLLVDCGLFQGTKDITALNDVPLPVGPSEIEAVVVTHGHLDHIGYLPKLVRDGFRGSIYCTPPTQALMQIVLDDAAHLQEELLHRGFEHERPPATPSYYDSEDVEQTMKLVQTVALNTPFEPLPGVPTKFHNAGHIIGSTFVALDLEGKRVVFSGDLGRYGRPLLYDADPLGEAATLVCESTYADRPHPPDSIGDLQSALLAGIDRGGVIVMPAFAVERTQEILLAIATIQAREPRIAALPIHLDSPMAEKVDDLFSRFPDAHKPVPNDNPKTPFGVRNLTIHVTTDDSKKLNKVHNTCVIISASGMASGGRVVHHLFNHVAEPKSTILFVGYQSPGTLGFYLTHSAKTVRLFGDTLPIKATITDLSGFSGHADISDFARWFATCTSAPHLYAVHGEPASAAALATFVKAKLGWSADVAHRGTTVTV